MTTSLFGSDEPVSRTGNPSFSQGEVAARLQQEAAVYLEVGEFFFRNSLELGAEMLNTWFEDVALDTPERRWALLEMLALYGLSAAEVTGGFPFTEEEKTALIASVSGGGLLKGEREHAANDVISLLQSGRDAAEELPSSWVIYREVTPEAYRTACLVFGVLTLETVREVAAEDGVDPAVLWEDWLMSGSAEN